MNRDYNIDSHKLIHHLERVDRWMTHGPKRTRPIYAEISPSGTCNHRCIFCALDYLEYKKEFLDTAVLIPAIAGLKILGLKSIMFAGEGEPLLHPEISKIVLLTKEFGIDVAITTNGVLLRPELAKTLLPCLSWIRVSLNAGTKETYAKAHRTKEADFDTVINNLKEAVKIKKENNLSCTIGAQFLLLPDNYKEVRKIRDILSSIGLDYLILKPYSQHPLSKNRIGKEIDYNAMHLKTYMELMEMVTGQIGEMKVIHREHTIEKLKEDRPYKRCLGLPFWTYITAQGDVYGCSAFLGDERFCIGNIYKQDVCSIYRGDKYKALHKMMEEWDTCNCREVCRLDEVNRFLWSLKNPPEHVNFI